MLRISALFLLVACAAGDPICESEPLPPMAGEPFQILWAGDTLLGDAAQRRLDRYGYDYPFERLGPVLQGADYRVLNLEGPITSRTEPYDPRQRWSYNAEPESAAALARAGFQAASLANNHGMDRGPQGLLDTLRHLEEAGVQGFGGGANLAQAREPLVIDTPHGEVAVFGFYDGAGPKGVARPFAPGLAPATEREIALARQAADRLGAEHLVAFIHWGKNYRDVTRRQETRARQLALAGFDLVVGHGAHVPQPVRRVCGATVVYSLGNFAFGTPGRFTREHPGYGVLATTPLGPEGFGEVALTCIWTDNRAVRFRPSPCDAEEAGQVLERLRAGE